MPTTWNNNPSDEESHPDLQQHKGTTEDTSAKGSAAHHHSDRRPPEPQVPAAHHSREEQRDRRSETNQSTQQVSGYGRGVMASLVSYTGLPTGPPQKDKYQELKEAYHRKQDELAQARSTIQNYDRELRRKEGDLNNIKNENQRLKDIIAGLQNELQNVHQELEDAKNLSKVRGKELLRSQFFLTKADALSISEVGEKVNALNEEIVLAAATLGEAIIHKRHEVSQTDLDAAAAVSQEMVGEKMTDILITQSQKPEPKINPLLVQIVLQIFMVKFCVSKMKSSSWYSGDSVIGEILSAIYSEFRSNSKHRIIQNQVLPEKQKFLEEQEVSGRWHALTRSNTKKWKKELYKKLQSVLKIASWKAVHSLEDEDSYGLRLPSIFKAINGLRMVIGGNFTPEDLDIFVFECDRIYDPANMDDAYGDGRQSRGKRAPESIVGTTGIGLRRVIEEGSAKDVHPFQTVIPAKIVLTSTLNEALEPMRKKPIESTDGTNQDGRD